mgnify:FL=1
MILDNELQHHGIKRQKWGVRRFQNPDGSLTPAGIRRYRKNSEQIERELSGAVKKQATAEDYEKALKRTKSIGDDIDEVRKMNADFRKSNDQKKKKRIRKSTEQLSDKELQQAVQRLNMEDNYTRMMMHREHLKQGESFVNKFLDTSATAVKGATTVLTIAVLMKELTKKDK